MVLLFLLAALLQEPVSSTLYGSRFLTGEVGGSIAHQCFYSITPANKHDRKYWCKIAGNRVCYTIISTTGYTSKDYVGRVYLEDIPENGTFAVTMTELKKSDTGTYRCGIGPTNRDLYVSLNLTVLAASTFPKRPKFLSGTVGGSLSVKCHYDPEGNYDKKYLCRWKEASCELLVDEDGFVHESYKGRIQIASSDQENGTYTVVMSHLREEDAGWYWCGAKNGHTEHTSSVKLRIQKETFSSQDPETSTLVTSTLSSPATYSTTTQRSITGLTYTMGTVTEITSTPLPTAPPGTFVTSPGKIYSRESSSSKSRLLPVVLSALILLIFITIAIFILAKIKLQKDTGEERTTIENLEAASVGAGLNPEKEQTMEETPSPEKVHKCRTDSGKRGWAFSGTGTARVISMIEENKNKF
ncbi:polymeric immunoglobulin receptor-like isoform X2 [Tyto alba]|uniref:polymeric immunoglobulin receptor-like isoform X2 n=1 Tax=Tyto alba TaxID=56313 RepID=UPI001C67FAE5|nr:polymeric immunoglobulin receptor-like isoform X2 [Tyto alba]